MKCAGPAVSVEVRVRGASGSGGAEISTYPPLVLQQLLGLVLIQLLGAVRKVRTAKPAGQHTQSQG